MKKVTFLRYMRLEKGMSARDLAVKAGTATKIIYHIENLTRKPSRKTTIKLCNALGLDPLSTDLDKLVEIKSSWITDGRMKTFD